MRKLVAEQIVSIYFSRQGQCKWCVFFYLCVPNLCVPSFCVYGCDEWNDILHSAFDLFLFMEIFKLK